MAKAIVTRTAFTVDRAYRAAETAEWRNGHVQSGAVQKVDAVDCLAFKLNVRIDECSVTMPHYQSRPVGVLSSR